MGVSPHDYLEDIPIEYTHELTLEDTTSTMEDESSLQAPCEET